MDFKQLINKFLSAFNYVDENGKRNGFLLFSNSLLTQDLERLAIDLKRKLIALADNNEISDVTKCDEFKKLIEDSFKDAQKARINHATLETRHEYYPPSFGSREGTMIHYTYKNPYKPSKFENELVNGVDEIGKHLDNPDIKLFAENLRYSCTYLSHLIKNYEPSQVKVEDWSYIP